MSWQVIECHQMLLHSNLWQVAKENCGLAHPVLEADFLTRVWKSLSEHPERAYLVLYGRRDQPDAALLLERLDAFRWRTFSTAHIPLTTACVRAGSLERDRDFISGLFRSLPGTPLLLKFINVDPDYLPNMQMSYPDRVESFRTHLTVRVDVAGTFDDYWAGRSRNLRRNLRALLNKLTTEGFSPKLRVLSVTADMDPVIEQHEMLERSGWKNVSGTPLSVESKEGRFYDEILKLRATQQRARVYQLYLGDRLAASQFALLDGQTLALLKTSYASDLSRFAPGRLLDYFMLQQIFAEGLVHRVEYCTIANEDDLRWSTSFRDVFEVNVFRWPIILSSVRALRYCRGFFRRQRSHIEPRAAAVDR